MGVAGTVAKKRRKPGPKPNPSGTRDALIALKCRQAYKDWVNEFAESERTTPSSLIDTGLVELAKTRGFKPPPLR